MKWESLLSIMFITAFVGCSDREPPEVRIKSPSNNSLVGGTVIIHAEATDNREVDEVNFYIDDSLMHATAYVPFVYSWRTRGLADSTVHRILVTASDPSGNEGSSPAVSVTVYNNSQPNIPTAPLGPYTGYLDSVYTFASQTVDPDSDRVSLRFAWGDGDTTGWSPFVVSGQSVEFTHHWGQIGSFLMTAQARDTNGLLSDWSTGRYVKIGMVPGTRKWRCRIGFAPTSSPALADTLFVGSDDGYLYAVKSDSTLVWRYPTGGAITSSPAVGSDGTIYVGAGNGRFCAINRDGRLKWEYAFGSAISASAAVAYNGTTFTGAEDGYMYALGPGGALVWRYPAGGPISSSAALDYAGNAFFGSDDGYLYALDTSGALRWRYPTGGPIRSSPALNADGTVYVGSDDGFLYALDSTGALRWRYAAGGVIRSSPIVGENDVYFGCNDQYLYAVSIDGLLRWRFPTGGPVVSTPVLTGDARILFGSEDGYIYCISTSGGLSWQHLTGGPVESSPVIGTDGIIYVCSKDGHLYAIHGSGNLAITSWPMFRHDLRHTGRLGGAY